MHIEDPFAQSGGTVVRPRPGFRKRAWPEAGPRSLPLSAAPVDANAPPPPELPMPGLNPLVQAASRLLLLAAQLRGTVSPPDAAAVRRHALDEIRSFEERARSNGVTKDVVLAARYVLCAALDEAALSTPWGPESEWAQQTLLVALHRESWGGEKFFEMLNRMSRDTARYVDLLELQYLCIAFGFAGKYQMDERGHTRLAEVQRDLYRRIRSVRERPQSELSLRWRGLENRRNPVIRYVPAWVVGAAALAIVGVSFAICYARLGAAADPVHAALTRIGTEAFATTSGPSPEGPRLKLLLAPQEQRGAVAVEENGGRTLITLGGRNLFASGSTALDANHHQTVRAIAAALNQVPGRVLVVGHTDDLPLASLRYRDNYDLSRERAVAVVKLLQRGMDDRARIEWSGAGPSQPRYRPESDPVNRARNRRVEIIHVSGS